VRWGDKEVGGTQRKLYDGVQWSYPGEDAMGNLGVMATKEESQSEENT